MDIFTPIIGAIASVFTKKALEDNSHKENDSISADASGENSIAIGKVGGNLTISPSPAPAPPERIDVPKDIYKESLENAVKAKALELQIAHGEEKAILQAQINELNNRLTNLPQAFEEAQAQIAELKAKLELEGNEIGAEKLAVAIIALEKGDFSKADDLFAEIEAREKLAVKRSARAATARGQIAQQEIRWKDAAEHYARAVRLDPCFETLIRSQKLAISIGDYSSALSLGIKTQNLSRDEYGEESPEYAISLNNLAALYLENNEYNKAEPLLDEAIKIEKSLFKENHPDTVASLNNIARVYQQQGRDNDAQRIFKQVLEIHNKHFGELNPHTADIINNLAGTYQKLEMYEKSEELHNKALTIRRQTLPKNHPNIANSLYNLSRVYQDQGRFEDAEPLCKEALEILETTLGPDHQHTILVKTNYERLKKRLANA